MQVSWFFATTPVPQRPFALSAARHPQPQSAGTWWARAGARLVAWGEQARHHRMGSYTQR